MNNESPQNPTREPRRQIPHEEISRRAEQLWRERGSPVGLDEAIWLEAESQLQAQAESRPVSGTAARPNTDEPAQPVRQNTKSRDPADSAAQLRTDRKSRATPNLGRKGP